MVIIISLLIIAIVAACAAALSANWHLSRRGITNEQTRGIYPTLSILFFFLYFVICITCFFYFTRQGRAFIHKVFVQQEIITNPEPSSTALSEPKHPVPAPQTTEELPVKSSMQEGSNSLESKEAPSQRYVIPAASVPSELKQQVPPAEISSSESSEFSIQSDGGEPQEKETALQQESVASEPSYPPTSEDRKTLSSPEPAADISEKNESVDNPPPLIKPEATKRRVQVAAPIPTPQKRKTKESDSCKKINEYMDSQDKRNLSDIKRGIAPTDHWENPINKSRYLVVPEPRQNGSQCNWLIDATINGKKFICHDRDCN